MEVAQKTTYHGHGYHRVEHVSVVILGREMAPWKLKVGIARCFRLAEPVYDIPRSSHWEYRTRSSDESESGESLLLTTMAPSASVPSPAGAGLWHRQESVYETMLKY